jgi:hypothetical protein
MAEERKGEKDGERKRVEGAREGKAGQSIDWEHDAYGPLDIKRHLKDDGRTLILYALRASREDT